MNTYTLVLTTLLSISLASCASKPAETSPEPPPYQLAPVMETTLDKLFIHPDAHFERYTGLLIEPVNINYSDQKHNDSLNRGEEAFQLDEKEMEYFRKRFVKAITEQWPQWQVTDQAGKGVLILKTTLDDFYLNASIKNDAHSPDRTLVSETSKFTLVAELVDSESGSTILHSVDKRTTGDIGNDSMSLRNFSSVRFWSDAYREFRQWARQLSKHMQ